MGAPYVKAVCMGRALMIPGMVGKNIGLWFEEAKVPRRSSKYGTRVEEIFVCWEELRTYSATRMAELPLGAIGIYTVVQKMQIGLQQLMAGSRNFRLGTIGPQGPDGAHQGVRRRHRHPVRDGGVREGGPGDPRFLAGRREGRGRFATPGLSIPKWAGRFAAPGLLDTWPAERARLQSTMKTLAPARLDVRWLGVPSPTAKLMPAVSTDRLPSLSSLTTSPSMT